MIAFRSHNEINKEAWDSCIRNSAIPLPYALSWWLDVVSPGWESLIEDDYNAVMPLTSKQKFGFSYLFTPWFTQQLGIFSLNYPSAEESALFLQSIPQKYRYIDIQLNTTNAINNGNYKLNFRNNFILDLAYDYNQLESNYHRNCRRNIQKALREGLRVREGPEPSVFSHFVQRNLDRSLAEKSPGLYKIMPQLIRISLEKRCGEILGIFNRKNELVATGWFVHIFGRTFFMVCASTADGRKNQSMYLLVDHMIREKSGSKTIFDFTGSNIPGVAYFNSGFGATRQVYPALKMNRLPWYLKLFKN